MTDPALDLPVAFPVQPILAKLVRPMPEGDSFALPGHSLTLLGPQRNRRGA